MVKTEIASSELSHDGSRPRLNPQSSIFNYIFCILAALMLLASCGHKNEITIEGTLENGAGKVIYIEEMAPDSRIFIDSITLDKKGHFKFSYKMPYRTFYDIHINENDYIVLLPNLGETITMTGCYDSLSNTYRIEGNNESQKLWQLQDFANHGNYVLRDIVNTDNINRTKLENGEITEKEYAAAHEMTDSIYLATFLEQQKYVVDFIQDNLGSLVSLIALYKPFNNKSLIDPKDSFEFYEAVLDGLEAQMPDNPHTLNFKNTVERTRFQYAR